MGFLRAWNAARCARSTLVAFAVAIAPAITQAQATVTGRVTSAANEPLPDSRVFLIGTSLAVSTSADGRYTLRNVPAGTAEVRVIRVGYVEQKKSIAVATTGSVTLDFSMTTAVVKLSEVVTTATGEQRRVEIGNSVTTIDATKQVEQTPITSMADLLTAKAPGVIVSPANMAGGAPTIRIRGMNSINLSNNPIVVVDGVRFSSASIGLSTGGTSGSFMNSLNPEEIEDIEIVKGPSAATLYGTDAANGVIVVTTKKGRAGNAKWNWFVEGASVSDRNNYEATYANWGHDPATGKVKRCQLATMSPTVCVSDSLTSLNIAMSSISPLSTGHNDNYGMQVSGGTETVRYFVGGDLFNEVGPFKMPDFAVQRMQDSLHLSVKDDWLHPEAFQRQSLRANISAALNPRFDLNVNAGFSKIDQRLPQVDNNVNGIGGAMFLTYGTDHAGLDYNPVGSLGEALHGYARYTPAEVFQFSTQNGLQRFTGSADAQWRPFVWMANSATVGVDLSNQVFLQLCHLAECPVFGNNRLGTVQDEHDTNRNFTAKMTSTSTWNPMSYLDMKTSVGADYTNVESDFVNGSGVGLPPGAQTVGATATKNASDGQSVASKTLGLYVQEQATFRDRLFLTGAVRTDQNSAFGTNFQRVFYPKLSVSWLMSDESFFPKFDFLNQFRFRAAYGASGVQPGRTDGLRTFSAQTVNLANVNTSGLAESALGNPNLKPEKSAEFETGIDTRLFNNRANIELTYYRKKTQDALISLPLAPSAAPSALNVLTNLGSIENSGFEATINAQLLDRRRFGWDVTISASHGSNKVASLGNNLSGLPNKTILNGANLRDSVGFPINAVFLRPYRFTDTNGDGIISQTEVTVDTGVKYIGYSAPRDLVSIQNGFDLFSHALRLNVLLDYKGGFSLLNNSMNFICQQSPQACREDQDASMPAWRQARAVAENYGTVVNNTRYTSVLGYFENGQFWRLREVSAVYRLPSRLARDLRAGDASLTFGARNLHVWTKYTGVDPESNYSTGNVQTDFITAAPRTYFTFRLTLHY